VVNSPFSKGGLRGITNLRIFFELPLLCCPGTCHSESGSVATGDSPRRESRFFRENKTLKRVQGDKIMDIIASAIITSGNKHMKRSNGVIPARRESF
jgi:hypothetical protein